MRARKRSSVTGALSPLVIGLPGHSCAGRAANPIIAPLRRIAGGPMQVAEQDTMPDTIEATLNYLLDTGEMPVTYVGVPGGVDTRSSSTLHAPRVPTRNGRPLPARSTLDRDGLLLLHHHTKNTTFFHED